MSSASNFTQQDPSCQQVYIPILFYWPKRPCGCTSYRLSLSARSFTSVPISGRDAPCGRTGRFDQSAALLPFVSFQFFSFRFAYSQWRDDSLATLWVSSSTVSPQVGAARRPKRCGSTTNQLELAAEIIEQIYLIMPKSATTTARGVVDSPGIWVDVVISGNVQISWLAAPPFPVSPCHGPGLVCCVMRPSENKKISISDCGYSEGVAWT